MGLPYDCMYLLKVTRSFSPPQPSSFHESKLYWWRAATSCLICISHSSLVVQWSLQMQLLPGRTTPKATTQREGRRGAKENVCGGANGGGGGERKGNCQQGDGDLVRLAVKVKWELD